MLIKQTALTPALRSWLVQAGDPGRSLTAEQVGEDIEIQPEPLSETEQREIAALLAADCATPGHPLPELGAEDAIDFAGLDDFRPEPRSASARRWKLHLDTPAGQRAEAARRAYRSAVDHGASPEGAKVAARIAAARARKEAE